MLGVLCNILSFSSSGRSVGIVELSCGFSRGSGVLIRFSVFIANADGIGCRLK